MGEWVHRIDPINDWCVNCKVGSIRKQGRQVCPVAWRNGHGQRTPKYNAHIAFVSARLGTPLPKGRPRPHQIVAKEMEPGVVPHTQLYCRDCDLRARRLPNRLFTCPTVYAEALEGIKRAGIRAQERKPADPASFVPYVGDSDADVGMAVTTKTRSYRTFDGRVKGG